jgi:hypothetical protein
MKRIQLSSLAAALVLACVGCSEPTASNTASQDKPSNNSLIDETLTAGGGAEFPSATSASSAQSTASSTAAQQPTATSNPASQPTTEQVPATVGVGKSGRKLDQYQNDPVQSIISTPAREYFQLRERIVFDSVKHALDLYVAEHGEGPKSHEDFMRDIIELNQIQLPELPKGQRYVYNPQTQELMVERPTKQ